MQTIEGKRGYGFLLRWVVILGDLLCLNIFFVATYRVLENYMGIQFNLTSSQIGEFFLLVNLSYFIVINFIPANVSLNIIFFDRIIQRALSFISLYYFVLVVGVSVFCSFPTTWYMWLICYMLLALLYTLWHIIFRVILKRYRQSGHNYKNVVIIGGGLNGLKVYHELSSSVYGYKICGVFDDNTSLKETLPEYAGAVSEAEQFCTENNIDEIYCTLPGNQESKILKLINFSEKNMIRFYLVPEFYKYIKRKLVLNFLQSTPIIEIRQEPLQSISNRAIKRSFDIGLSLLVLTTLFPILYIIGGLIIKIESRGPILFKQKRTGLHGKVFMCYKFRSMKINKGSDTLTTVKTDPRITKVGDFLRKTSLDEIPQFINVLLGDMSVVGPRPHMVKQTEIYQQLIDAFMIRHLIKPGITGWAQISGCRGEIKSVEQMEERFKCDVWYIENWSFFLDLKIIIVTAYRMFAGDRNAF